MPGQRPVKSVRVRPAAVSVPSPRGTSTGLSSRANSTLVTDGSAVAVNTIWARARICSWPLTPTNVPLTSMVATPCCTRRLSSRVPSLMALRKPAADS